MTDKDKETRHLSTPNDAKGVLPDGVRGTTRDTPFTRPADEHAGYPDPTEPELRKPSEDFEEGQDRTTDKP